MADIVAKTFGTVVRTGLSVVPYVGNAIATAWSEWDSARRMERVEATLRQITDQLLDFEDRLRRKEFDSAHMQFLEMVLRQAEVEHAENKRRRFANLLVSYWVADEPVLQGFDEASEFLRATVEFGDAHITVLRALYADGLEEAISYSDIAKLIVSANADAIGVLDALCTRFGLVKRSWTLGQSANTGKPLFSTNLSPEGIARGCFHAITPRGKRYIEFALRGEIKSTRTEASPEYSF